MTLEQDRSPLQGTLAFTGRLASMKRADAFALVRARGGTPSRGVTRNTDALVVGGLGWPLLPDGQLSKSLSRAQSLRVPIVSERRLLEWAGRELPDEEARAYSADQLAGLSGLPLDVIGQLALFGLLDPRDGLHPYRDVMAVRQFAMLFEAGVGLSVITSSLHEIRRWLPEAGLSNLKLYPASADAILVEQLKGRTDKTGQFVLPVDDAARAESGAGPLGPDGLRELPPPEPVGRDGPVEGRQLPRFLDRPLFRLRIQIDHRLRQREALLGEAPPGNRHATLRVPRLPSRLDDSHLPRVDAGFRLQIDPHQRGLAARVGKEPQGPAVDGPLDRRALGHVAHVEPGDVAELRFRWMPGGGDPFGRAGRARDQSEADGDDAEPQPVRA
jgi:hypothetical protein